MYIHLFTDASGISRAPTRHLTPDVNEAGLPWLRIRHRMYLELLIPPSPKQSKTPKKMTAHVIQNCENCEFFEEKKWIWYLVSALLGVQHIKFTDKTLTVNSREAPNL